MAVLALAQGYDSMRAKTVKKYFHDNRLNYILVCQNKEMTESCNAKIDRAKYDPIEIINISDPIATDRFNRRLLKATVHNVGVMKYPCLLSIEGNELKGGYFRAIESLVATGEE